MSVGEHVTGHDVHGELLDSGHTRRSLREVSAGWSPTRRRRVVRVAAGSGLVVAVLAGLVAWAVFHRWDTAQVSAQASTAGAGQGTHGTAHLTTPLRLTNQGPYDVRVSRVVLTAPGVSGTSTQAVILRAHREATVLVSATVACAHLPRAGSLSSQLTVVSSAGLTHEVRASVRAPLGQWAAQASAACRRAAVPVLQPLQAACIPGYASDCRDVEYIARTTGSLALTPFQASDRILWVEYSCLGPTGLDLGFYSTPRCDGTAVVTPVIGRLRGLQTPTLHTGRTTHWRLLLQESN